MNKQVKIKIASTAEIPEAQAFYKSVGYADLIKPTDKVVMAIFNQQVAGVARISLENKILVLRGMQVDRTLVRQGIGSLMLSKLNEVIGDSPCYCLPHDWLETFYAQIGFIVIPKGIAPPHLKERIAAYLPKYPHLIFMGKNI